MGSSDGCQEFNIIVKYCWNLCLEGCHLHWALVPLIDLKGHLASFVYHLWNGDYGINPWD